MGLLHLWAKSATESFNEFNRGVYEAILPPADVYWIDDNVQVKVDLAGFDANDVDVELKGTWLYITAKRDSIEKVMEKQKKDIKVTLAHRPLKIHAHIPLPFDPRYDDDEQPKIIDKQGPALVNGVLTVNIGNLPKRMTCKAQQ